MKDPLKKPAKRKDFARINSVKIGGGPHGGRTRKRACKRCGTVHGFRVCPYCGEK
jgi:hypothetical protein